MTAAGTSTTLFSDKQPTTPLSAAPVAWCLPLHGPGGQVFADPAWHRYESLGAEGYHSLFKWYQRFEAEAFPDPQDLRGTCSRWTGGLYPGILQAAFALFDVPEAIAVSRNALCRGVTSLTRLQVAATPP